MAVISSGDWGPKRVDEDRSLGFNFASALATGDTISSTLAWTARVKHGTDASPGAILSGSPSVASNVVSHLVIDGVDGVFYEIEASVVTTNGETLEACDILYVSDDC